VVPMQRGHSSSACRQQAAAGKPAGQRASGCTHILAVLLQV
jgi:hypothetical protein